MAATLVITHDLYQTLLAPSYGLAAAAQCSFWLVAASVIWQCAAPFVQRARLTDNMFILLICLTGAICAAAALALQQGVALLTPIRMQHDSVLWSDMPGISLTLLGG